MTTIAPTATITFTATPAPTETPAGQATVVTRSTAVASPGATVSVGSFSYTPTETTNAQVVSSVTVSITHPLIFQSLTLTAFLDASPAGTVEVDAPDITDSTVFTFNPVITIPSGGSHSLSFTFTSVIAARMASRELDSVKLAGIGLAPPSSSEGGGWLMLSFSLLGLAMLPFGTRQRRRATLIAATLLLMAAAFAGCGGGGGSAGPTGQSSNASTQEISAVGITVNGNPVGVSGLPIDLGTVHRVGG
jgi:hypothetical protein